MSALDAVIGPELIALAEQSGACSEALAWLRDAPRTWSDLRGHGPGWLCWGIDHGLAAAVLPELMRDPDTYVRWWVAKRIDPAYLPELAADPAADVRQIVAERLWGGS